VELHVSLAVLSSLVNIASYSFTWASLGMSSEVHIVGSY